jgi:hypothetical protein
MPTYKGFVQEIGNGAGDIGCLGDVAGGIGGCGVMIFLVLAIPIMIFVGVLFFIALIAHLLGQL